MVVCICNNINDKTIAAMATNGACIEVIKEKTGATTCCGCCHEMVCSIVSKCKEAANDGKCTLK